MAHPIIRSLAPLLKLLPKRSDFTRKAIGGTTGRQWFVNAGPRAQWYTNSGANVRWSNQ